jgi:hypothetical protein
LIICTTSNLYLNLKCSARISGLNDCINKRSWAGYDDCVALAERKHPKMAERTFIMVKPDGVQRHLVGEIISVFEAKVRRTEILGVHYQDLSKTTRGLSCAGFGC